ISEIQPQIAPLSDSINRKLVQHPLAEALSGEAFRIYIHKLGLEVKQFRQENVPLQSALRKQAQEYGAITGGLAIEFEGEKLTMPQAGAKLQDTNRALRQAVFEAINAVRIEVRKALDDLLNELVKGRDQVARNADYANFRDYAFDMLGRVDYTAEDCYNFHESIAQEIVPLVKGFHSERKAKMKLEVLKPYDLAVDPEGNEALAPFKTASELLEKSVEVFKRVDPYFGDCLSTMNTMGHLDLASKPGKAPGGYNYPLYEIGVPFIFMNAVGTQRDMVTMMHEGGHAVHSFLTRDLPITSFKSCPSEVAELASMAMELLSMDHWDVFYSNPEDLKRAKKDHLQDLLSVLPWIATVDEFQHWLYLNPEHPVEARTEKWISLGEKYSSGMVDWSDYPEAQATSWQKQLHVYEVPFYYIEYGMAQLGAIAVYRNYRQNPEKAIQQYKDALSLGYTKSIGEIYKTAGIAFDFSQSYVRELADFIRAELKALD
ncbi:MAG: M3 family oligoendopeptidase, partial [Flavobacteriales bacterium]|nr:M3 family oligoendopeptidase [Flavobacteriales bacterium]